MPGLQELQEKARKEKEIQEILAKEIKEWRERQENYSNPKLLPSSPKNQTKVKSLTNKIKTQLQQAIKLPKFKEKSINNPFSIYRTLLMAHLIF